MVSPLVGSPKLVPHSLNTELFSPLGTKPLTKNTKYLTELTCEPLF